MKYVLLTGASSGLGIVLAKTLLEKKYFVILHYNQNSKEIVTLHEQYPNTSLVIQADLTKENDILRIKTFLEEKKISLDILINNAAIDFNSELEEKNPETFLKVFSLNTLAPFLLMKMFRKEINQNYGSIINISSDNTLGKNDPRTMEYDVSKAGLNMLTKDFALELPHAHVNAIAFGWLDTKMNDIPEDIKKYIKFVPLEKATKEILTFLDSKETGIIKEVSE